MTQFQVGDRVVCVHAPGAWPELVEGALYTVKSFDDGFVTIVNAEGGEGGEYLHSRFAIWKPSDEPSKPSKDAEVIFKMWKETIKAYGECARAETLREALVRCGYQITQKLERKS